MGNTNQVPEIEPYELQHIQDLSEEWIKIPITGLRDPPKTPGDRPGPPFKPDSMVLMDDYLIIFGFEDRRCSQYFEMDSKNEVLKGKERPRKHIPFVLAVDLRDRSIQHVRLEDWEEKCPTYVGYSIRYKLHKCSEKEILVFDTCDRYCCFQLSIESFQSLSVKSKRLKIGKEEKSSNENVEISQDCFYIVDFESKTGKNLWCLDMEKKAWKTYKTVGETLGKKTMHFVFKDDLYAYNSNSKICILDSDTMEWKRCFQRKVDRHLVQLTGDIYNDHLMILSREQQYTRSEGKNQFHCWDINTNSWKVFNIQSPGPYLLFNQLIVYKNSLWAIGNCQELDIHLVTYNLEGKGVRSLSLIFIDLGFEASISFEEQQRFKRLFMNEESSDVKFKLQEKTIPAHKEVLIKRSRFFAGLFRSGMAETKQGVIEITDCDWTIFQAFLRFLYCDKIKLDDKLLTFKLFDFADKYAQHDLKKRCFVYLKLNIDPLTALEIFIEARGREMNDLLNWCIEYFENNGVGLANISELMKYLINNPHKELRAKIFDWIMVNYSMIYENQKESLGICEEFLMNNIEMENLARISQFVAENERFEKEMVKLEDAMYRFGAENWGKLPSKGCAQGFTMNVLKFKLKMNEKANGRKRMEPGKKNDKTAENPQLKKTKKSNKSRK